MKFGVLLSSRPQPGADAEVAWSLILEQVRLMARLNFDSVWLGDRHILGGYFQPLTSLAGLSGIGGKLSIGTAVLLLPLYHPLHVAEIFGMLDILSGGKVVLGVGAGWRKEEFDNFDVSMEDRFAMLEESIGIVRKLWTTASVTYHGRYYHLIDASISPNHPLTKPHPPIWVGGATEKSVRRVAVMGDAWLPPPRLQFSSLKRLNEVHTQERKRNSLLHAKEFPLIRDAFVADDSDVAREVIEKPLTQKYAQLATDGLVKRNEITLDAIINQRMIIGGPDDCISEIEKYAKELGVTQMIFRLQHLGLSQDHVINCMNLIGQQIIPYFKEKN